MSASLAETVPEKNAEPLRIYCPAHNLGFTTPRSTVIKCESGGHELDSGFPYAGLWEYCCDCQHYWRLDASKAIAENECPACDRKISRRFLCGDCNLIATESDTPGRRKIFSISTHGTAIPVCPGCLLSQAAGLEHDCAEFGVTFLTPRSLCPFCNDALDPPPSFPCSISTYLETLRRNVVKLKFDPASNLLRESNSGDYILIPKVRDSTLPIVIPAAPTLSSKQDYYNTYYELFNCDNPAAGEVIVLSPAVIEKTDDGWQLREAGFIDIKHELTAPPEPTYESARIPCAACGEPGDIGHAYCKRCGSPMLGQQPRVETEDADLGIEEYPHDSVESPTNQDNDTAPDSLAGVASRTLSSPSHAPWKSIIGVAAVVLLIGIVITLSGLSRNGSLSSEPSLETKLDRAIAAGTLFGPASDNVHDLYYAFKNSGASDEKLRAYRDKITPLLTAHGYQLINGLMQIGYDEPDFTEWQEASKSLDWAEELNPGNSFIGARAAYGRGRAAYLQKNLEEALQWWTKSADLDKSWVLPVNGQGMVHTGKRNWATARTCFFQALQRDANWPFPHENIGNTYLEQKDFTAAKESYQNAIAKAPNWAKPHLHLGYIAMVENDFATAVSQFEAALSPNAIGLKGKEAGAVEKALEKARQKLSEQSID